MLVPTISWLSLSRPTPGPDKHGLAWVSEELETSEGKRQELLPPLAGELSIDPELKLGTDIAFGSRGYRHCVQVASPQGNMHRTAL